MTRLRTELSWRKLGPEPGASGVADSRGMVRWCTRGGGICDNTRL